MGYIRVGLGKGGEINLPRGWQEPGDSCGQAYTKRWGYTVGDSNKYTWNAYLEKMLDFEGGLHSAKQLMVSITPVRAPGVNPQEVSDLHRADRGEEWNRLRQSGIIHHGHARLHWHAGRLVQSV